MVGYHDLTGNASVAVYNDGANQINSGSSRGSAPDGDDVVNLRVISRGDAEGLRVVVKKFGGIICHKAGRIHNHEMKRVRTVQAQPLKRELIGKVENFATAMLGETYDTSGEMEFPHSRQSIGSEHGLVIREDFHIKKDWVVRRII